MLTDYLNIFLLKCLNLFDPFKKFGFCHKRLFNTLVTGVLSHTLNFYNMCLNISCLAVSLNNIIFIVYKTHFVSYLLLLTRFLPNLVA